MAKTIALRGMPLARVTPGTMKRTWKKSTAARNGILFLAVLAALSLGPSSLYAEPFLRGDANGDGSHDVSDPVSILLYLFVGHVVPNCEDALDVNDDGTVDVADPIYDLDFLFRGGPPPPAPGPFEPGFDETPDDPFTCGDSTPPGPTTLLDTNPRFGETGVVLTRETIVYFSRALEPATVTAGSIRAEFAGELLPSRPPHVSSDATTVTLFYEEALPAGARVRVIIDGGLIRDARGELVDADGDGSPGGVAILEFDTVPVTTLSGTAVCGRVFASEFRETPEGDPVNMPLEGVTLVVVGVGAVTTDALGNFRLEPAPVGRFYVHINGTTVAEAVLPDGSTAPTRFPEGPYYPNVGKIWESVAGRDINVGNVYLPLIRAGTLQPVSEVSDTVVTLPDEVVADLPDFANVSVTVPAESLFNDDGTPGTMVGIAPVPPDRLPGELPEGLEFPVVITVQTDGATNFDTPAPVCFPNLEGLEPGTQDFLYSFDHDRGKWVAIGPATVSDDGELVCTDEGVGILAPGWHAVGPPPATPCPGCCAPGGGPPPGGDCPPAGGDGGGAGVNVNCFVLTCPHERYHRLC